MCIDADASVMGACRLMRARRVDELVVTERQQGATKPLGVVSAREIVTRVLALGLDPCVLTAGDLVSAPAADSHGAGAQDRVGTLCAETLPLVNTDGEVIGVVSLDDVLQALARSEPSRFHRLRS